MPLRFVVPAGALPERVDKALTRLLEGTSRATVQRWIEEGRVQLNGKLCRARDRIKAGASIEVEPGSAPLSRASPDPSVVLRVIYQDPHLLVIDKPAGMVVHPARGHWQGTLVQGLLARADFQRAPSDPRDPMGALRPGIVHRIDKGTSGLLVVAKDERTREGLKEQLSSHRVERVYLAITLGVPQPATFRTRYGRDPRSRLRFSSQVKQGRFAVTHLTVQEVLAAGRAALVTCRLETGRTHQIRVHLSEQAHTPLLADALYGKTVAYPALHRIAEKLGRQALHAQVLGFVHPISGETLRFEAPIPEDFAEALASLREQV